MTDEEKWERRWIKACRTIAEREEKIEQLQKEYANLEASWNARPTGTRSQRESQLEKEVEQLKEQREVQLVLLAEARQQRDELKAQIARWESIANSLGEPTPPCDSDGPTSHQPAEGSPLPTPATHSTDP